MSEDKTRTRASARTTKRTAAAKGAGAPRAARRASGPARRPVGASSRTGRDGSPAPKLTADGLRDFASSHRVPLVALLVAAFVVVTLYGPACSLYQAWRDNGMLTTRQAQASAESEQLESDINSLMTEDGIKDEARERGYVEEGETRIVVEGLDAEEDSTVDVRTDASDIPWYLRVTDFIFRYDAQDASETQNTQS